MPHEILEQKNRSIPLLVRELLFFIGWHVSKIDHLDQFLDQFRLGQKIGFVGEFLEVDLSLGFFATMTLYAILLEQRLEKRIELVGPSDEPTCKKKRPKKDTTSDIAHDEDR